MCDRTIQDLVAQKRVEGHSQAPGHEEGPRGFGLRTGDCGYRADHVGNCRRPAQLRMDYWEEQGEVSQGLLFFFLKGCTSDGHALRLA